MSWAERLGMLAVVGEDRFGGPKWAMAMALVVSVLWLGTGCRKSVGAIVGPPPVGGRVTTAKQEPLIGDN